MRRSDRKFIEMAYKVLWEVWKYELPTRYRPRTIPWLRILLRSGFMAEEHSQGISLAQEAAENCEYLKKILDHGGFGSIQGKIFIPNNTSIEQDIWLDAVEQCRGGAEGGSPDELNIMDTHMAGIVRWLNYIGITTTLSCDGHGRELPRIEAVDTKNAQLAAWILNGTKQCFKSSRYIVTPVNPKVRNSRRDFDRKILLDIAEWLHSNHASLRILVDDMRVIAPL